MIFVLKKKYYFITAIVLVGLLLLLVAGNLIDKEFSVSANTYFITKITFTDKDVDIHGGTTDSAKRFTGFYLSRTVGDTLFIKPFYSTIASSNRNSDFKLGVGTSDKKIAKIYMIGRLGGYVKQIWPEE